MPPKIAKRGTNSQIQQAIANTQASSSQDVAQPDAETQVDADTQVDDDHSSTANSQVIDDALASTADGAAASTADTTHTSADEAETETKPAAKRPAGKKVPAAATDTKDGEAKKKRRRKPDYSTFSVYIWKGLKTFLIFMLPCALMLIYTVLVMKQVHPDNSISQKAMQIMDDFIRGK
jgi:hypothetical protein